MPDFKTIHTTYGLAAMAQAEATGISTNLTHMAVGDGGGAPVEPSESQTSLVNERYRATINSVHQDPEDPNIYYVEMIIPAAVGGWWIREFGIFDDDGNLYVVGNFPDAYKTLPGDGATNDLVVRVNIIVSNAGVITLQIDPAVTVATRQWVLQNITTATLTPGGTTGQVLTKQSNADGDADWETPGSSPVIVNTVEETQEITADPQVTFNLAVVTTLGLAVYVEGVRIPKIAGADGWQQGVDNTQVVLGTQYPIGSKVTFAQNEPTSGLPNVLDANQNLADVDSIPLARANLDVHSKAESNAAGQPGDVKHTARSTAPTGWLKANGAAISRTVYADLFAAIGATYGPGDGVNTFNVPDLRGEFIRGWDDGRGVDPGRAIGSAQADAIKSHDHGFSFVVGDNNNDNAAMPAASNGVGLRTYSGTTAATGGTETRSRNVALLACIKY